MYDPYWSCLTCFDTHLTSIPNNLVLGDVIKIGSIITVKIDFDDNSF